MAVSAQLAPALDAARKLSAPCTLQSSSGAVSSGGIPALIDGQDRSMLSMMPASIAHALPLGSLARPIISLPLAAMHCSCA